MCNFSDDYSLPVTDEDRTSSVQDFRRKVAFYADAAEVTPQKFLAQNGAGQERAKIILEGPEADAAREIAKGPDSW